MSNYSTIKDLVIDSCTSEGVFPSYEKLTKLVLDNFPNSKWQKTHYAWYKSKIKHGVIEVPGAEINIEADSGAIEKDIEETIEASLSLERDLHTYLAKSISMVEPDLVLVENGIEYQIDAGRIDLLAKDITGNLVVIELKAGKAKDAALGQLLGYIGCLSEIKSTEEIRGVLIASDFDKRVVFATKALSNIKLIKYTVAFSLETIT